MTAPSTPLPGSTTSGLRPTLASADYCSADVFDVERRTIFHRGWMYVCHIDGIAAGTRRVFAIAGESVLLTRDLDGGVHAFANVCRHRGSQLCDPATTEALTGSIRCQYHSWTYALDGRLVATPRVDDDFDRGTMGLWPYHAEVRNGMVFVCLAARPEPFSDWLARTTPGLVGFGRLPIAGYRIAARTETIVQSNWKIIIENYSECLHCAVVHPELAELIPLYRSGNVVHPDDPTAPVAFAEGRVAFTSTGQTTQSVLPGVGPRGEYDGISVFPNVFFDLTPTVLSLTAIFPLAADRSLVVGEYLFAADNFERPDFDPTPEVEFNELVGAQDYVVCEMVQRGVASKAFTTGGLTRKDAYVADFIDTYIAERGPLDDHF